MFLKKLYIIRGIIDERSNRGGEEEKKMFECEICGIETEDPKLFGEKLLCEDCYNEQEDVFCDY